MTEIPVSALYDAVVAVHHEVTRLELEEGLQRARAVGLLLGCHAPHAHETGQLAMVDDDQVHGGQAEALGHAAHGDLGPCDSPRILEQRREAALLRFVGERRLRSIVREEIERYRGPRDDE